MSAGFDPYAEWLQVPADRRPPTHYELLGLPAFEADAERIRKAVMARTAKVRRYQLGQYAADSLRLQCELSRAFDCLCVADQKRRYDAELRGEATLDRESGLKTLDEGPAEWRTWSTTTTAAAPAPIDVVDAELVDEPPIEFIPVPTWKETLRTWPRSVWRGLLRCDLALQSLVGKENTILHFFLRAVLVVVLSAGLPWFCLTAASHVQRRREHADASTAESRARGAKASADAIATPSFEPPAYTDAEFLMAQASAALAEERFADAKRLFDDARERFAQAPRESLRQLAVEAESRAREAKSSADMIVSPPFEPPSYSEAELLMARASAALAEERYADAKQLFDGATKRFAESEREELAKAAGSRAREAQAAVQPLLTTLREPPSFSDAERLLKEASAAMEEARFADAVALFEGAAGRFTEARESLEEDSQTVAALVEQLRAALANGDSTEAAVRLAEIEALSPREPLLPDWKSKLDDLRRGRLTNSIGMKLVLLPDGAFTMGSGESTAELEQAFGKLPENFTNAGERPVHPVRITRPFYMGAFEVTKDQFAQFVEADHYKTDAEKDGKGGWGWSEKDGKFEQKSEYTWRNCAFDQGGDHPAINVSFNDALAFCEWMTRREGKTYRPPTEAEWEYACRAGTTTRFYNGGEPESLIEIGNVADATSNQQNRNWSVTVKGKDGYFFTAPVGRFRPNAFGLYDMTGNVLEWCSDWYGPYGDAAVSDPIGPISGDQRVMRGGAFYNSALYVRSTQRVAEASSTRYCFLGFRVARNYP